MSSNLSIHWMKRGERTVPMLWLSEEADEDMLCALTALFKDESFFKRYDYFVFRLDEVEALTPTHGELFQKLRQDLLALNKRVLFLVKNPDVEYVLTRMSGIKEKEVVHDTNAILAALDQFETEREAVTTESQTP